LVSAPGAPCSHDAFEAAGEGRCTLEVHEQHAAEMAAFDAMNARRVSVVSKDSARAWLIGGCYYAGLLTFCIAHVVASRKRLR